MSLLILNMSVKRTILSFRCKDVYYTRPLTFILLVKCQIDKIIKAKSIAGIQFLCHISFWKTKAWVAGKLSGRPQEFTQWIKNMRMSFSHSVSFRIPQGLCCRSSKIKENCILIVALSLHLSLHILESVNFTVKKYISTENVMVLISNGKTSISVIVSIKGY